jgi:membrane-associated phospholipid phosphatase
MHWLNRFDVGIMLWLNHFAGHHPAFDKMVLYLAASNLTSIVVIVLILWLAAFDTRHPGQLVEGHEMIFGAAIFAMLATLFARAIAISMPFRPRPMATPSLHFRLPAGGSLVVLHWSAFPSDHATLFLALAVGILPVCRRLGCFAVGWAAASCLPLLYEGIHWPTDLLAGAVIGAGFVQLVRIPAIRASLRRNVESFYARRPALFFSLFFLWSYETTILFDDLRRILFFVAHHA